jgi:hypothetical protein
MTETTEMLSAADQQRGCLVLARLDQETPR